MLHYFFVSYVIHSLVVDCLFFIYIDCINMMFSKPSLLSHAHHMHKVSRCVAVVRCQCSQIHEGRRVVIGTLLTDLLYWTGDLLH